MSETVFQINSVSDNSVSLGELLKTQGYVVYSSVGNSMRPLLRQHMDLIEIQRTTGRIKKYDVVLYKRDEQYILHRILKIRSNDYVIAGDHNTFLEYGITDDQIIGIMTRIIRNGKEIRMTDIGYRLYVHLWCDCYPVRMTIIRNKTYARKVLGKLKRKMFS